MFESNLATDIEESNLRMIRSRNCCFPICCLTQQTLHVRLTRHQPNFADEYVIEFEFVLSFDSQCRWRRVRLQRI